MLEKKVLIVFANPQNTMSLNLSKEKKVICEAIKKSKHGKKIKLTCLETSTIHDFRRALLNQDYEIVHIASHGNHAGLILEDEFGKPHKIPQKAFTDLLHQYKKIECVILNACYSFKQGQLISSAVPYTIAMENKLYDETAIEFSRGFYDAIGAGKDYQTAYEQGCINVRLIHSNKEFPSVFFQKEKLLLRDTVYVNKSITAENGNESVSENGKPKRHQVKSGIPPVPDIFLGREEDIETLKERLGVLKGGKDTGQIQILTALRPDSSRKSSLNILRGSPGIGKTAVTTVLAEDKDVAGTYSDGILWTALGQNPKIHHILASWGSKLGNEDIYSSPTLKEGIEIFSHLIKNKKILIIIDDVWKIEDVIPFKAAIGKTCSLLVTTRTYKVVNDLSVPSETVHNLPGLSEDHSVRLLEILAPSVVSNHRKTCYKLVHALECLPLALQVAGRMLNTESKETWGVEDLLNSLIEGKSIIDQKAPADLMDLEKLTIPTVATLLRKSLDVLSPKALECFAYLAPYREKPVSFDLEALKASWQMDDPKPIIMELTGQGLLERAGDRYQVHSLLLTLARSLFL